jgi:aspartokinase/homoserine dehydrogenase 1
MESAMAFLLLQELSPRTRDRIVSFGELLSSMMISARLQCITGRPATWMDSSKLITTNNHHGNASVDFCSNTTARSSEHFLRSESAPVIHRARFYFASDTKLGNTTTLGRGGSDYTAAIYRIEAPGASVLEIWTDVSGMMTADPRLVPNAKSIQRISYQEAMELSHFGAKIIYPPTIQPVMSK